jgi:hypothetical protein
MVTGKRTFVSSCVAVTLLALSLTACAGDESGAATDDASDLTLAASKSPVQLLRNDAAGRVPPAIVDEVEVVEDVSVACLDLEEDPLGLSRSWNSTAVVTIQETAEAQIRSVIDELVASYVEQGWVASEQAGTLTAKTIRLRSDTTFAEILVSSVLPEIINEESATEDSDRVARVQIKVEGPCVVTDGTGSDEVRKVEGR